MYKYIACLTTFACISVASAQLFIEGNLVNGNFDGEGDALDAEVDFVWFEVLESDTSIQFDVLALEQDEVTGLPVDLNGDGDITLLDPWIRLIDPSGNFLASNDDADLRLGFPPSALWPFVGAADGSVHAFDAYLEWTFPQVGVYGLAIGQFFLDRADVLAGYREDEPLHLFEDHTIVPPTDRRIEDAPLDWRLSLVATQGRFTLQDVDGTVMVVPEPRWLAVVLVPLVGLLLLRRRYRC